MPTTSPLQGIILAGDSWLSADSGIISQIQNATRKEVTNLGVGGSKSADTLKQLNDFVAGGGSFAPGSIVVLNVGGNDFLGGVKREVTRDNLDQILSLLNSQGVKTVLSGAPGVNSVSDITSGKELSVDPIYKDVAAKYKNTTLIDGMSPLLRQPDLRTEDNIHLTNAGQMRFVETLLKGIDTVEKQAKTAPEEPVPVPRPVNSPRSVVSTYPAERLPAGLASVAYTPQAGLSSVALPQTGQSRLSESDFGRFFTTLGRPGGIANLVRQQPVTPQPLTSTITEARLTTPVEARGVETFQQAQPMATFDKDQIAKYISDLQKSGGTTADIARAMDEFDVTPAQVAEATNLSLSDVQNLYNQTNPTGQYSTTANTGSSSGMFSDVVDRTVSVVREQEARNAQIANYIRDLQAQGKDNAFIAAEMDRFQVNPGQVATALNLSATDVQNLYNQVRPEGLYSTVPRNTGTTTTGTTTGTTTNTLAPLNTTISSQQIYDYVIEMQRLGRTEADIAAEMDRFGVTVPQMAQALSTSPVVIQDLYNVARPRGRFSTVLSKEGVAGFERPTYGNVQFTGQEAPGLPAVIPTIDYVTTPLISGTVPGASRGVTGLAQLPAPEPYAGVPAAPARPATNMKEGGLAGLAQKVQSAGRNGDTMLAHITPQEAGILQLMGGSGTINPQTGLPEFWNPLREIRRAGRGIERGIRQTGRSIDRRITQPIIGELNNLAERLGPIGQLAAMYFGGPIGAGIYAGFAAPGDDFNFKKAAQTAALTYAGREMLPNLGGSPTGGATPMSAADYSAAVDSIDAAAGVTLPSPGPGAMVSPGDIATMPVSDTLTAAEMGDVAANLPSDAFTPSSGPVPSGPSTTFEPAGNIPTIDVTQSPDPNVIAPPTSAPPPPSESLANLAGSIYEMGVEGAKAVGINTLPKAALAATMGTSLIQGQREREKFKEEQARIQRETAERRRRYREQAEGILNMYPIRFAAEGGMMDEPDTGPDYDFAKGGMPPRFLSGGGDGMSDSIPATIGDSQPARLADGEFVIPADVVSGLGNGSSKAGAKQLYAMMDRIRKARTGTTKQGKEINPRRFMPA